MPQTDNAVDIEAPIDFVWERMNDVENWPNLFSEYAKTEIVEREGNKILFRLTTHPDPEYDGRGAGSPSASSTRRRRRRSRSGSRPARSST